MRTLERKTKETQRRRPKEETHTPLWVKPLPHSVQMCGFSLTTASTGFSDILSRCLNDKSKWVRSLNSSISLSFYLCIES